VIKKIFGRVVGIVDGQKKGNSAKSWWRWPLIIVFVLLAVSIFAWLSRRHARELAKLRHERKIREVEESQAQSDIVVAEQQSEIDAYEEAIRKSSSRISSIDTQIKTIEDRFANQKAAIDRIRTWDDFGSEPSS